MTMWKVELEAALLRAIAHDWKHLNWSHFREKLTLPTFELLESAHERSDLGRWVHDTRTLQIARKLVLEHPWGVVFEVLKHEMAHQFVDEVLGAEESAHGPAFRKVCEDLGIDAAARGVPVATADEQRILDRVSKLLALAESPNLNEARAAMAAAQKLLLKYNLEARGRDHARGYAYRHVGAPSTRHAEHEKMLATLLGKHFFVETIWIPIYLPLEGKRVTVLELTGTPANLEIAEYVHNYLMQTAARLWRDHKRDLGITSDRDRRMYLSGVMSGFSKKLAEKEQQHRAEGLVWVRDADLEVYFGKRHPRVRTFTYGGGRKREAFAHGRAAGEKIVLHRGVTTGPVARGRLLKA